MNPRRSRGTVQKGAAALRAGLGPTLGAAVLRATLGPAVLLVALTLTTGCGAPADEDDGRPLVVTSIPPLYSLVANIAGDDVRLENLLPPGASPHQTSFTPAQAKLMSEADLLVVNGAGLELWLDDLVASTGREDLTVVEASTGLEFLRPDEPVPVPDGGDPDAEAGGVDPHVWLDVSNAVRMVATIRDALAAADPDHAADYRQRAAAYTERLQALDSDIRQQTASLPHKEFVSFHSAFQYYARAYGLRQVAVLEEFPGKEPSPAYLAGIVDLVKRLGVRAVFSEPQFSARPAEALARETGIAVHEVDPEGRSLSASGYEDLMRANTRTITTALGGSSGG